MSVHKKSFSNQIIFAAVLLLGVMLVIISAFYPLSALAIIGMIVISLGAIFLYITPVKHVPLTLLNSSTEAAVANIERLITELNLTQRGVYYPPKKMRGESVLVFIPKTVETSSEGKNEELAEQEKVGISVMPPGAALSRLFEKGMGYTYGTIELNPFLSKFETLFEQMDLAESAEVNVNENIITVKIFGSIFDEICRQTDYQPKTHKQVGCLLSSAIACILTKATGKPITLLDENQIEENKITVIEYQICESAASEFKTMQVTQLLSARNTRDDQEANEEHIIVKTSKPAQLIKSDYDSISFDLNINGGIKPPTPYDDFEVEVAANALDFFKKTGDVFILTDLKNPQFSYSRVKDFHPPANFGILIKFEAFVLVSKTPENEISEKGTEFTTKTFKLALKEETLSSLESYVEKSGYSTVDDWIKNVISETVNRKKLFYLYRCRLGLR